MPTALSLITDALRTAGVLASGETPTADEAQDALRTLGLLLEHWSLQPAGVWDSASQTFALSAGVGSYSIGPGGALAAAARPVRIASAYTTWSGVDYPVRIVTRQEYEALPLKTQASPIVELLSYVNAVPLGLVRLWPVPSQAVPLVLTIDTVVALPAALTDALTLPPGAELLLRLELALALGSEYGRAPSVQQLATAARVRADYQRANRTTPIMAAAPELASPGAPLWQRGW